MNFKRPMVVVGDYGTWMVSGQELQRIPLQIMVLVVDMSSQLISWPPHMIDGSVIEDLGGGAFSSFLGK